MQFIESDGDTMSNQFYEYIKRYNDYERNKTLKNTLGLTVNEFQSCFNSSISDTKFNISTIEIEKDENQHFKGRLNEKLFFWMSTQHYKGSDYIKTVLFVGSGDGTTQSGFMIMQTLITLIEVLNPEKHRGFSSEVLKDIGIIGDGEMKERSILVDDV